MTEILSETEIQNLKLAADARGGEFAEEALKVFNTIQALQAENYRLREAMKWCADTAYYDEEGCFVEDVPKKLIEALSSTPAKALEVRKAEEEVVETSVKRFLHEKCVHEDHPRWGNMPFIKYLEDYGDEYEIDHFKAVDKLQSIKGDR